MSRTPNLPHTVTVPIFRPPLYPFPNEGVRETTSQDPTVPIEPKPAPPLPERRTTAVALGKTKVKSRGKRDLAKKSEKKTSKGKVKSRVKMSLHEMDRGMEKIREEIEAREKDLRDRRRAQFSLRMRKNRVERLESSQSPLFKLYENETSNLDKKCILCGHAQEVERFDAATQVDRSLFRRREEAATAASNPFNLGVLSSEQKDEEERKRLKEIELSAARERIRNQERRKRGNPKISTGELVDTTSAPPPPKPRLGEEAMPEEKEDLIGLTEGWNGANQGPLDRMEIDKDSTGVIEPEFKNVFMGRDI